MASTPYTREILAKRAEGLLRFLVPAARDPAEAPLVKQISFMSEGERRDVRTFLGEFPRGGHAIVERDRMWWIAVVDPPQPGFGVIVDIPAVSEPHEVFTVAFCSHSGVRIMGVAAYQVSSGIWILQLT